MRTNNNKKKKTLGKIGNTGRIGRLAKVAGARTRVSRAGNNKYSRVTSHSRVFFIHAGCRVHVALTRVCFDAVERLLRNLRQVW